LLIVKVANDKLNFSDLSSDELDKLKDVYVDSRLNCMTNEEIRSFVKITIEDQIKGTVGKEEEREAWKEMRDHFKTDFEDKVLSIRNNAQEIKDIDPEKIEMERRMKLVEKRKEEKEKENEDMW